MIHMRTPEAVWAFSPSIDATRRASLESVSGFDAVINRIVAEAIVVKFDVCRGKEGYLKNCYRPEFELKVSAETADLFFNSPAEYRAQYLADPDEGQKQNGRLLGALMKKLVAFASTHPTKYDLPEGDIKLALFACSAKVWLPETSLRFNHELIEEITVPLWRRHALVALVAFANRERPWSEQQEKAIWGLRALLVGGLDVKGAFLDPERQEVVPHSKICRRFDIHDYGFA